ncbi:hypothetical protein K1X13_05415 [Nocardioides sp. WL0053]|uniref:SHOCT domain-containing protein n=1 Tax=Nocardioides jiangsuensis TaxID=2866161 RepID=A0ABS7RL20_9ACTN|nr:SHOCT domain-containing protein [Nocardioides jiangsuensis]MBY9074257.1 hypothetical protein [Nocardioides jiangsuensis]
MGLADELENLQDLHRTGVLTNEEYAEAKARVLADAADAPGPPSDAPDVAPDPHGAAGHNGQSRAGGPRPVRKRARVVGAAVLAALVATGVGVGVALAGDEDSRSTDEIEQMSDAECQELSDDLMAQNKPMSELYPTLRGLGCGKWLDQKFEEAADDAP